MIMTPSQESGDASRHAGPLRMLRTGLVHCQTWSLRNHWHSRESRFHHSELHAAVLHYGRTGTKSYSPIPWRTRNVADLSPALVTRCGRLGATEKVSPGLRTTSSLGFWR